MTIQHILNLHNQKVSISFIHCLDPVPSMTFRNVAKSMHRLLVDFTAAMTPYRCHRRLSRHHYSSLLFPLPIAPKIEAFRSDFLTLQSSTGSFHRDQSHSNSLCISAKVEHFQC